MFKTSNKSKPCLTRNLTHDCELNVITTRLICCSSYYCSIVLYIQYEKVVTMDACLLAYSTVNGKLLTVRVLLFFVHFCMDHGHHKSLSLSLSLSIQTKLFTVISVGVWDCYRSVWGVCLCMCVHFDNQVNLNPSRSIRIRLNTQL